MDDLDLKKWSADGYYVLPKFYSHEEIDSALAAQSQVWSDSHPRVVVDDLATGKRSLLADVSEDDRKAHRFKVNDLYLEVGAVRYLALNERISGILSKLLRYTPVLCNSLSFEQGSAQPDHVDSLYMTPATDGHLIAIWVALEDCDMDAGPLRYYPGSNRIPAYVFSNGSRHYIPEEMPEWERYVKGQIQRLGLAPITFAAKKGDVFVWSCNLLHGGSPINNHKLTRRSLVFHYYSHVDAQAAGMDCHEEGGAYWLYRRHQPVNGMEGAFPG